MTKQDLFKQKAARAALDYIKDGMIVGLGTGSTVSFLLDYISEKELDITGVTTSKDTSRKCRTLGIRVVDIDMVDHIDVTIDGADEVDAYMNGIKGGGAALLMEKIVANNSKTNIWIVDETKVHSVLGSFPLPIEIISYGSGKLIQNFEEKGYHPVLRLDNAGNPVVTDTGHNIIDLNLHYIDNPQELAEYLESQVGVVEHGLFINIADVVIIGGEQIVTHNRRQ